jgi:hypothetical protein
MNRLKPFLCLFAIILLTNLTISQTNTANLESLLLSDLKIDMQWFLSYLNGENKGEKFNKFTLKRGYVNIKKKINDTFSGRITTDITVDKEGDGEGDVEIRLKYLYLKCQLPSFGLFYKPYFEFGLVHRPWLDFEQHINLYRVQGTMFLERNDIISSGDYGVVFLTLLGGEMDEEYKNIVNKSFAGKYGSLALGIFNGGGYHALENNENKALEGRITIRPFYNLIPGLQFSYHGAFGKGNIPESPDWNYNSLFISHEEAVMTLTGQYYNGKGNYKGSDILDENTYEAISQDGYSLFGEMKLLNSKVSIIGRYDFFNQELLNGEFTSKRIISGLAYHFISNSKIILDYDVVNYSNESQKDSHTIELAVELRY